ncbi:MAG TPA: ATP-binding protein [Nocardioidaceae bacterium]|nr:ATP-binding protein [Nocardioidaceae bacterium]
MDYVYDEDDAEPGLVGMSAAYGGGRAIEDDERFQMSDVSKLGRLVRRRIIRTARFADRPTFPKLLAAHLQTDVDAVEVVEESWPPYDLVNVQVGLDAFLAGDGVRHELIGMRDHRHREFGLTDLLRSSEHQAYGPHPGNVAWTQLASGPDGEVTPAALAAIYLVTVDQAVGDADVDGPTRLAFMLRAADPESGIGLVQLHLAADRPGAAAAVAAEIRRLAIVHNVFRGQVISFRHDMFGERASALQFHRRPHVSADHVILPAETLAAIRRQVVGVASHRERLLAAGQHLKRGLLLYGPPGVGKTHSVRFLISQMTDVTIVELSGDSLHAIGTACSVARTLQPAMIVVEDVDLIAEEREMYGGPSPLLFELLNEMDGLAEDTDVVFLLTTNRADMLEPALAARPGRVDQAVVLEVPDAEARRRLFALYRGELDVDESNLDAVIERTDGVTASFLKELLRRAALIAAEADGGGPRLSVSAAQLDEALDELMDTRNAMTRTLLGGRRSGPDATRARPPWMEEMEAMEEME